jgi:hypothetical protein
MHEHSGQEVERIESLGHSQPPVSLSSVENLARGRVDRHSVEADGWMKQLCAAPGYVELVSKSRLARPIKLGNST